MFFEHIVDIKKKAQLLLNTVLVVISLLFNHIPLQVLSINKKLSTAFSRDGKLIT